MPPRFVQRSTLAGGSAVKKKVRERKKNAEQSQPCKLNAYELIVYAPNSLMADRSGKPQYESMKTRRVRIESLLQHGDI